ncbi:phosphatidylserine decarboxylase [Lederbergia citrea]|uniref:phosphatidylserine decarboxylase n=1 Tax=Lederbergia citrea TaxID=2833581 RepID=A0A942UND5_9BACI|nr:phosphatidylserine decarboxylase [Lederbergia citrea]MBS4176260.1 phosphatidylserine decarboxylase [Lederbergia citrea]MBS4202820.1 phosphatidylserine decarboxylase [Lederbergia citrea]MBS4222512.1 phosphatidylserine decarboxylase [Lederbergia citrea]
MKERLYRSLIELTNGRMTSMALGKFARSRLSRPLIKTYAKAYKINQKEMLDDIHHYPNLHAFFIRKLKKDARPIDLKIDTVTSPVDGILENWGIINEDCEMIVKNKSYSIEEMLGGIERSGKYSGGTFMILYLSPAHYHRIHSPLDGKVIESYSLGRKSYPVNRLGLKYGKSTLAKNFRTITELKHGDTTIAMVKVGAMFINSVKIINQKSEWKKGEEAAYFSFGSTVVLLFEKGAFQMEKSLEVPTEVQVGEALGRVIST